MTRALAGGLAALALIAALTASTRARAEGEDGVYGRFAGDVELRFGAGAAVAGGGTSFAATAGALYMNTAGVYALYTDSFGSDAPLVRRSIATGIHLQPLFLARLSQNGESGPAQLDLFIDSFALELGAFWVAPRDGELRSEPGLELAVDLGAPLFASASGPFLGVRGALRWRPIDLAGPGAGDAIDRGALLTITLGYHQILRGHVVDVGDRKRR